ncbi:MAG TPA: 5-formyltetrahydrofolate cyclo-ligase [Oscillatoriales cyanobacterium M59_W2019_021]|nr:MAG: 5-formyltetrahydrofolate cyclo-ligase [Cyanobacteria bacterium J055]HIK33574.1 5-formyltetrahydrofolate cyclo-ligase [Oscillatoriales cyanobacterium M4454_W2019_049]HIK51125.1 5-formyltetrahydrofolate cyclo-ligase [Oscillatoriales cyanobacterium M59_W2019_021]
MNLEKKTLRRSLLKQRQALSIEEWREKSDRLCMNLQASPQFISARTILTYFSFRQEPDLSSLLEMRSSWGIPRCVDRTLVWHRWQPGDPLLPGAYGILEPDSQLPQLVAKEIDLILVPAVACDDRGYRLGYGGGYYDRLFASPEWASIPTIGIVFEFAYLPELPVEPWDKPLDAVCTEAGFSSSQTDVSPVKLY